MIICLKVKQTFESYRLNRKRLAFFCISILLLSMSNPLYSKDKILNYLKNGVSFSIPSDWRTISDESLPDRGYFYSAESTTKNSTGLFSFVMVNNVENPVKSLLVQQTNMKEELIYKESGIEFTEFKKVRFGSMDATTVDYQTILKGIKISGTIYCFNCSEKTYFLFFQSGIKDSKYNSKVFKMIELTFACR